MAENNEIFDSVSSLEMSLVDHILSSIFGSLGCLDFV